MLASCHSSSLSAPPPPTLMHTQHMWLNEIQTKGKTEKGKDLPAWCLCLCMGVCVCGDVSVYLWSLHIGDVSFGVKGSGGEEPGDQLCAPSGVRVGTDLDSSPTNPPLPLLPALTISNPCKVVAFSRPSVWLVEGRIWLVGDSVEFS